MRTAPRHESSPGKSKLLSPSTKAWGESAERFYVAKQNVAWRNINQPLNVITKGKNKTKEKMGFFDCLVWGYSFLLPLQYLWSNFSYNIRLSYILLSNHWEKMFFYSAIITQILLTKTLKQNKIAIRRETLFDLLPKQNSSDKILVLYTIYHIHQNYMKCS